MFAILTFTRPSAFLTEVEGLVWDQSESKNISVLIYLNSTHMVNILKSLFFLIELIDAPTGPISSAEFASASILSISYLYIKALGNKLQTATKIAILNANYMASRLKDYYPILFSNDKGRVAHEFIIDIRPLKAASGIGEEDIAKRLIDYGFHSPTMSFPVGGTLMMEPTESENKAELDRFCDAMISIKKEIEKVQSGVWKDDDNPLKNAPHTAEMVLTTEWNHCYTREEAAYPLSYIKTRGKYWPPVGRVNNVYGDRNLDMNLPLETPFFN
jgi:glycine dehydrogenase